ncbi:MAG: pilus assembly PilX N-terminal domain-containing protein [Desulfobacterales bacterium]|nr:pilus assembly PilX N-terminal domain-containing protein [Desulfobacterales bacterium]
MFIVLLIMVTLTIAGLMATEDTITENWVARNYAISKQNLYMAEGAAKQAAQRLDLLSGIADFDDLMGQTNDLPWVNKTDTDNTHFESSDNWPDDPSDDSTESMVLDSSSNVHANASYAVDFDPPVVISGEDADIDYAVYGLAESNSDQGEALVEVGFRKRVRAP